VTTTRLFFRALAPVLFPAVMAATASAGRQFEGRFFSGSGDVEYLRLLDVSRRMFAPDPEFQNLTMLYAPSWNGLKEGPRWDAWWIQNSYGTTYAALPFLDEPWSTFLQNSHDLWFDQMGDGKRAGAHDWVAPDGCLCDCARPGWVVYKQGDGRIDIHDWGMEFTAAGLLMQAELLLVSRHRDAIAHYLPMLERSAAFIETRRDPEKNLFLAGPAGNLLAPSYAGWKKPDGTYGMAYLTGLSVTYIAALDRLIEVEKLAGRNDRAEAYQDARDSARRGLDALATDEGYFIRSLDPDGVRHGVYGAEKHGYLETSPNHDAIALRIVDDAQAKRIYERIASIPELRPHDFIIPNYPSYDDLYTEPAGLWKFGHWVNGGHWSTCEARMMLAYYRLGRFEDARRSMRRLMTFAESFRMDNPLTSFGSDVYFPNDPIHLCYDSFGPPAAFIRGLFGYIYKADSLTLIPRIPPGITRLEQHFPIRFGEKRLYIGTIGAGPVTSVVVNGEPWDRFDSGSILLPYEDTPEVARLWVFLGGAESSGRTAEVSPGRIPAPPGQPAMPADTELAGRARKLSRFRDRLAEAGLADTYEAAHARVALETIESVADRHRLLAAGTLGPLPEPAAAAARQAYVDAALALWQGLESVLAADADAPDPQRKRIYELWTE